MVVNLSLTPETARLARRVELTGKCSIGDALRSLLPHGDVARIIEAETGTMQNPLETLAELVSAGLRLRMMDHSKPISPRFLESFTADGLVGVYNQFIEAVCLDIGILTPKGEQPRFKFAQYPPGGRWQKKGYTGWTVIHVKEILTPDDIQWQADGGEVAGETGA